MSGDESPIRWWEWFCLPLVPIVIAILLLVSVVIGLPLQGYRIIRTNRLERIHLARMGASGRIVSWEEVERMLLIGSGTLMIEHLSPAGPLRAWWTDDDIIARAPMSLPRSIECALNYVSESELKQYAILCFEHYLDDIKGVAKVTKIPFHVRSSMIADQHTVGIGRGWVTTVYIPRALHLAHKYPKAKIVTMVLWLSTPLLMAGDETQVFLRNPSAS
jgi:hypothetical protein